RVAMSQRAVRMWRGWRAPAPPPVLVRISRRSAPLFTGALLALAAAAWAIAAPAQLGGQVSYVTVTGNSMEPGITSSDLAIVRAADHYQVGDVVLYRHPDLGPV